MSFFESPDDGDDGDDSSDGLRKEGIKCVECGTRFVRTKGFVGNYCGDCRYDSSDVDHTE